MVEQSELRELGRIRWCADDARRVVSEWTESGLSGRAFARMHGMNAQRLSYWQQRFARPAASLATASEVSFVAAEVVVGATVEAAVVVVRGACGVAVEVVDPGRVSADWVAELVQALEARS